MTTEVTTEAIVTEEVTTQKKVLTIEDPIDEETLERFKTLQGVRMQCAERLLDLEQEKVRTLRMAAGIDQDRQKVFEAQLVARGLPPNFPVEIDAITGKITPVGGQAVEQVDVNQPS